MTLTSSTFIIVIGHFIDFFFISCRRAVILNDLSMLKRCLNDRNTICDINPPKSLAMNETPLDRAIITGNVKAMKLITEELNNLKKRPRVQKPRCHLKRVSTGIYNSCSLGLKHIRKLNPARGGREGNNALVKEIKHDPVISYNNRTTTAIIHNVSFEMLTSITITSSTASFTPSHLLKALERGRNDLAAKIIDFQKSGYFSKFHIESLIKKDKAWDPPIREASAKKAGLFKITPIHTACLNPRTKALEEVYMAYPNIYVADSNGRKPVHYAAVCSGTGPLQFLLDKGANLGEVTKDGVSHYVKRCCRLFLMCPILYFII